MLDIIGDGTWDPRPKELTTNEIIKNAQRYLKQLERFHREVVVPARERREKEGVEYMIRKYSFLQGRNDRLRYKQERLRKEREQGVDEDELWRQVDELIAGARDPVTGGLGKRKGETSKVWEDRIDTLQGRIEKLWVRNRKAVGGTVPRYLDGFPARHVRERNPPLFLPHIKQTTSGLNACEACTKAKLKCSRVFGLEAQQEGQVILFIDEQDGCRRCERNGVSCRFDQQASANQTADDNESINPKIKPWPLWYDDNLRQSRI